MLGNILFILSVFCSILSQHPLILETHMDEVLKLVWVLPFLYFLYKNPRYLLGGYLPVLSLFVIAFFLFCLMCEAFCWPRHYMGADCINIMISFFVCMVSYAYWRQHGNQKSMNIICITILAVGLLLSAYLYQNVFANYDIAERTYAFQAKNSMGQILLCIVVIVAVNYKPSRTSYRYLALFLTLPLVYVIFIMKSRATLAGLFFVLLYAIFKAKDTRVRMGLFLVTLVSVAYVMLNPEFYSVVVENILLGSRDASDVNSVSSGRVELIGEAVKTIPNNLAFGIGDSYLDCMPIAMIVQYGIVGSSIVFLYLYSVTRKIWQLDVILPLHLTTFLLLVMFLINALFEAYPPFGPGVKCFFLWMMMGFSFSVKNNHTLNRRNI